MAAPEDRITFTFRVHRLAYAELWRLSNGSLFAFATLLSVKWLKLPRFDRTDTSFYRPTFLNDPVLPAILQDRFTSARVQYEALGFRYLGTDAEVLRVSGCMAHFVRGPILALHLIGRKLNYSTLTSFPPGCRPITTANGRNYVDSSPLHDGVLLSRPTRLPALVEHHLGRITRLNLPELTESAVLDQLEQLARSARDLQIARGVIVPQPLASRP